MLVVNDEITCTRKTWMWRCSLRGPCGSGCSGVCYGEREMQFEGSRSIYRNLRAYAIVVRFFFSRNHGNSLDRELHTL